MAAKGDINPDRLPSTEKAATFHTLRVHLQIMFLETLDNDELNPLEWGWSLCGGNYEPISTNTEIVPEQLLHFARCKCKNECVSMNCLYRKHGLICVTACGNYQGDCMNGKVIIELKTMIG